jgi:hypothetical protein
MTSAIETPIQEALAKFLDNIGDDASLDISLLRASAH